MASPRIGLSGLLVLGGGVLLIAIGIGNSMGNRVLSQVAGGNGGFFQNVMVTPVPVAGTRSAKDEVNWKKVQVMSVATDPAFPDPRVTPEPTPEPTARPVPKPTPRLHTPPPTAPSQVPDTPYPGPEAVDSAAHSERGP